MINKIKLILAFLWQTATGLVSPLCLLLIIMLLTGNGKGAGHDLGSDAEIDKIFGCFYLLFFLSIVGNGFFTSVKAYSAQKKSRKIPVLCYVTPFIFSSIFILVTN